MYDNVRVGVVGTSGWVDGVHLPSLKSHPRAQVVAICGRNRERAEEVAHKYEVPHVFTDYREIIANGNLDALVIVTPDDLHYPMTMAALDAGLHVLCEKPLALNAGQARQMLEKASTVGVKHMVFFTFRWIPRFQYVRDLLDDGYIGRCFHCQFRFLGGYGLRARYRWRFDGSRCNGVLGDLGSHMIDLARWYVGDVARVSASLGTYVDRPGPEGGSLDPANDAAILGVEFASGALGTIEVSGVAHIADRGFEKTVVLHGDAGTLRVDEVQFGTEAGVVIRGARHDCDRFQTLSVPEELLGDFDPTDLWSVIPAVFAKRSVGDRQFIDAIVEDRPAVPSFHDGLKAQEVIDAAIKSHEQGVWVSL